MCFSKNSKRKKYIKEGLKSTYVEHIDLDCCQIVVSEMYGVRDMAFIKLQFWTSITAPPFG